MLQLGIQIPTVPTSPLQRRVWNWKLIRRLVLEAATTLSTISRQDIGHVSLPLAITGPGTYQFGLDLEWRQSYGNLQEWVVGDGGPLGTHNPEGGLTIATTPEPNSGLMLAYAFYWVR